MRATHPRLAGAAALAVSLALAAGSAAGVPQCSSISPAVGATVTCTYFGGGGQYITVPPGTGAISIDLKGAGGAGGPAHMSMPGSAGGAGARVEAALNAAFLTEVTVVLGAPGVASGSSAGQGGGYSALYPGIGTPFGDVLAVAGGGGGGAFGNGTWPVGGSGAALGTAAGGAGVNVDGTLPGGQGGSDSAGGAGGAGLCGTPVDGVGWAQGGAGGQSSDAGGNGGAGYGGGGKGCGGGGGAGGSFVLPARSMGDLTYSAAGGAGGAGGTNLSPPQSGTAGTVSLTFIVAAFAVTYDANGASGGAIPAASGSNWIYDTAITVQGNTGGLTRPGFQFAGWNTAADGSGTPYAPGATLTVQEAVTLYAQWTPVAAAPTAPPIAPAPAAAAPQDLPAAASAGAALPTRLAARYVVRKGQMTSSGTLPSGATRVVQTARAKARPRPSTGRCTTARRAYRCSIRLSRGTWTVTTTARGAAGVVAQGTRRVVVR